MPKKHSQTIVLGKKLKTNAPTVAQSVAQFLAQPKTSPLLSQISAEASHSQSQNFPLMPTISLFPRASRRVFPPQWPHFSAAALLHPATPAAASPRSHLPGHVGLAARQRHLPSVYCAPPYLHPVCSIFGVDEVGTRPSSVGSILSLRRLPSDQ